MGRALEKLTSYRLPIIIAGDIFDRWQAPHEVVNFLFDHLRGHNVSMIPGQHDLPNHRADEVMRSAYGTLTRALWGSHVSNIQVNSAGMTLAGFGWDSPLTFDEELLLKCPRPWIAVVHKYCWTGRSKHPGAEQRDHVGGLTRTLRLFDAIVIGDNHIPFQVPNCKTLNCGSFLIRHQSDFEAGGGNFWLLNSDLSFTRVPTSSAVDQPFVEVTAEEDPDLDDDSLESLDAIADSFEALSQDDDLLQLLNRLLPKLKISKPVKELIRATFIE